MPADLQSRHPWRAWQNGHRLWLTGSRHYDCESCNRTVTGSFFFWIQLVLATFETKRPIRFSETNHLGQVHFDTYLRLMEETEYAFLRSRGLRVVLDDGKGVLGFPRLRTDVQLNAPLCLGDVATTVLRLTEVSGKQITYDFHIRSSEHQIATATFEVACCRFPAGAAPYAILIPDFVSANLCADSNIEY